MNFGRIVFKVDMHRLTVAALNRSEWHRSVAQCIHLATDCIEVKEGLTTERLVTVLHSLYLPGELSL